jgi:hypothetical protein
MLFVIVLATSLAGLFHAPWWSAVVGGCFISLVLLSQAPRWIEADGDRAAWDRADALSSLCIAAVAAPLSFASGRLAASMWGL